MLPSVTKAVLIGLVAALGSVYGCSGGKALVSGAAGNDGAGGAGGEMMSADGGRAGNVGQSTAGASGSDGLAGSTAGGAAGTADQSAADAGDADAADAGDADAADAGAAGTGAAGTGAAGVTVTLGFGGSDITTVVPTAGCGMDPGQAFGTFVRYTMQTSGTKAPDCADSKCGPWSYVREYFLELPVGYDETKAYPLLIEGPGNGGSGINLYALPALAGTVIRVGLTPPPVDIGHSTNPGQGCFDDREGDDSVDWPFYENLYDKLAGTICFDRNRVFAAGRSSSCGGAWLANELGCKYAGDPSRPVRGMLVNDGGLPTDPRFAPTCTDKRMAGLWIHTVGNTVSPFSGNIVAMDRALTVNGCVPKGVTFQTATFEPFPISATDSTSCKKFVGCPAIAPLVVCPLFGNQASSNDAVVNPAFTTFLSLFERSPLLTE
jgi:hypothetical protein